jgi:hypothetical protein
MNKNFNRYAMLSSLVLLTSCASTRTGGAAHSVNEVGKLSAGEWSNFAQQMVTAISQSGVIDRYWKQKGGSEPIVLAMGDWHTNNADLAARKVTSDWPQAISSTICSNLVATGKVVIKVRMGDLADRSSKDNLVRKVRQLQQSTDEGIDLRISGRIVVTTVKGSRTTRTDYAVTIQLLDARKGHTVFMNELILPKSFSKGWFGG